MSVLGQENLPNVKKRRTEMIDMDRALDILSDAHIDNPGSRWVVGFRDEDFAKGDWAAFVGQWFDGDHEAAALVVDATNLHDAIVHLALAVLDNIVGV